MFGVSPSSIVLTPLPFSSDPSNISSSENEDIIILENPDLVKEEKEVQFSCVQALVERLHQLARFSQSADAEQIAELLVSLNEFLQREPCFLLEHYQVRILQLKKMLSDAERLPGGDQLCSVLRQHLIHAEQAASTLYRDSANPAQDSLWPLYERILHLPTLEPDLFGAAVAVLTEKLPHALAFDPLVEQLQALLPQLLPPAHYLWGQTDPYTDAEQELEDIKQKSLVLLHRLRSAPEGYLKLLCTPMQRIFETYRDFLDDFRSASERKRAKMRLPKAQLNGVGLGLFLLGQEQARALLGRSSEGVLVKGNSSYTHAVYHDAGVFYKANFDKDYACIRPEMEFAIHTFYQLLGKQGVAPTCLAKISHVFLEGQVRPHGWTLQAGYGIEGILLKDLLTIANILPFLKRCLEESMANEAFQWLVEDTWQQEFFNAHPHLTPDALSSCNVEDAAQRLLDAFEAQFIKEGDSKRCREFTRMCSPDVTRQQFIDYLKNGSQQSLLGCLALLRRYPDLAVTSTKDICRHKEGWRPVSCNELVKLQLSVSIAKKVFPDLSTKQLLEELPQLMARFDLAEFSTHFVITLLTNPTDHKADNLMVTLTRNEQGGIRSCSLVGIDNDQALVLSENGVRSMLYLLDLLMSTSFDSSVTKRLLEMTPEGLIFSWLVALEEQNQSYTRWQQYGAFLQEDSFDTKEPPLHIPLRIDAQLIPNLYAKAKQLGQELTSPYPTHWELLRKIQPKLARLYESALEHSDDSVSAYEELDSLFNKARSERDDEVDEVARLFREVTSEKDEDADEIVRLFCEANAPSPRINEGAFVILPVAALQFLESLKLNSFPIEQQVSLIGKAQRTFPTSANTFKIPGDAAHPITRRDFFLMAVTQGHHALVARLLEEEKKSRIGIKERILSLVEVRNEEEQTSLLLACLRLDLEMIQLLMHYGADPQACDMDGRGILSLCLTRFCDAPGKTAAVIRFLGDQPNVLLNASNKHFGGSPLHYLVEVAEQAPEEAEPLIAYLIKKGANPDLVDDQGKSPLDHAMERNQERVVKQLIHLGAGRILNAETARIFFDSRSHLQETFAFLLNNSLLLRWHLALDALRSSHSLKGDVSLEGVQLGKVTLPLNLSDELLDKQEDIKVSPEIVYGLRNVNKITLSNEHELFFKQYPQMPGVEYAIDTLFKLLIGHGTSFTDFARLTKRNGKSYPVLISQGVHGDNLQDVLADPLKASQLKNLDPLHFSELLLASLLVNFEDAKPDNFILELLPGGTYRLVGIDNDHAFVPPLVKEGGKTVQVKCILYCLDQMQHPLHPYARERFLSFKPERLLRLWLSELQKQNERYCLLFPERERRELFKPCKEHQGMVIPVVLKPSKLGKPGRPMEPGAIVDIYQKFRRLQIALQEAPNLTGMEALRLVIPPLGIRYEEAFHSHNTPLQRFLSLAKNRFSMVVAGRSATILNSQQTLKSMGIPEKSIWKESVEPGPTLALKELKSLELEMQATNQQLSQIRDALQEGNLDPFNHCQLDISKEKVINGVPGVFDGIDFKAMSIDKQKTVLSAILMGNYRSLHLCGCTVLNEDDFTRLVHSSPQLLLLELRDCASIDHKLIAKLSKLNYLTKFRLSDLPKLKTIDLSHAALRQLEIIRCQGLKRLTISPSLKSLTIDTCFNLSGIETKSKKVPENFVLQTLHLKACPKLQPWFGMFESWLKESTRHEIQLQQVPPYPMQEHLGFVLKAIIQKPEANEMLASLKTSCKAGWEKEFISCLFESYQANPSLEQLKTQYVVRDEWLPLLAQVCPNLTYIDLSYCYPIAGLGALGQGCRELSSVKLSMRITDSVLKTLANVCPNLSSVHLARCDKITNEGLQILAKGCPKITYVNLRECKQITHKGLQELAEGCPNLSSVDLENCNHIGDKGLQALAQFCSNLTSLNLSRCGGITVVGVQALAKGCPNLTFVSLNGEWITDAGLEALAQGCPDLTNVDLSFGRHVTDAGLQALAQFCSRLSSINLTNISQITDAGLQRLAQGCPNLTSVNLSSCIKISDTGLQALAQGCPNLTSVYLGHFELITDIGLQALADGCPNLTLVDLTYCRQITDAGLQALAQGCPNLTFVDLDRCIWTTIAGLHALAQGCPNLTSLNLGGKRTGELRVKEAHGPNYKSFTLAGKEITEAERAAFKAQYPHIRIK